jgi:hypothetical protein
MTRILRPMKWMGLLVAGGMLMTANGCLAPNFYSTLLGDTIVTGVTSAVLNVVLASAGLQP